MTGKELRALDKWYAYGNLRKNMQEDKRTYNRIERILSTIQECGGDLTEAARQLGVCVLDVQIIARLVYSDI